MRRFDHVNIISAGATGDNSLLNPQFAIFDFIPQGERCASLGNFIGRRFDLMQNILQIVIKRINFIYVGGMKGQGDHRLDAT